MIQELQKDMEKDDTEYVFISSMRDAFEKLTFKEVKERQVPAKTVVSKLIECRNSIKQNEYFDKLNYKEITYKVFPYALSLSNNINTNNKNLISNEMFVHDNLIGLSLYGTAYIKIENGDSYELFSLEELITDNKLNINDSELKKICVPTYDEECIVSINDLKVELEKNGMSFKDEFSIEEILKSIERMDWFTIMLDKNTHIGNSLSENDIIEYISSSAKEKLDIAYSFDMPYICEKAFLYASKKEKKLMVIDILTNCENTLDSFMEEAKKAGALDEPIYIMGYSLKDYINGNKNQENILKKLGYNYECPETRIIETKHKIISDLFITKELSEKQKQDFISSEFQKLKK